MQTIIILLNPGKLDNPDLDLRYRIPDRIEKISHGAVCDNGYDYIDAQEGQSGPLLGIWLETESAAENWPVIVDLFRRERFLGNDLSCSAELYISASETAEIADCRMVFPEKG